MRKPLVAVATAALLVAPVIASTASADQPTVTDVNVTSTSTNAWSQATIDGNWHITDPTAGDSFTVSLNDDLTWPTATSFPLTERDSGTTIAQCELVEGRKDLTCTFNSASEQWDRLDGTFQARAQITSSAIGKTTTTIVVGGATVTVNFLGASVREPAHPGILKSGWYASTTDGQNLFRWYVNVSGSTDYTIVDPGAAYQWTSCTTTSDWSDGRRVDTTEDGDTITFTAPSAAAICRSLFETTTAKTEATNTATVNGTEYSAEARKTANGSGEGDGSTTPAPTPSATATTPAPTPSATATTPAPTPSATATTPAPTPSATATTPAPVSHPTTSSAPVPVSHPTTTRPSGTSPTPVRPGTSLAHTGTDAPTVLAITASLGAAGLLLMGAAKGARSKDKAE